MPTYKNNPKKTYKGTEPSPKGFGYCIGDSKDGLIKKGTNINKWTVLKNKNDHKRWVKDWYCYSHC